MSIKILIVDDSPFMRRVIADRLTEVPGFEVVGTARNGKEALNLIPKLNPSIVTLDIEMPGMNGLDTLQVIKKEFNIPVIMLSSLSGKEITIQALELGAVDFIEKPQNLRNRDNHDFKTDIEKKINALFDPDIHQMFPETKKDCSKKRSAVRNETIKVQAIVIGASTGGPKALLSMIRQFPENLPVPVFIVQHMPKGFTASFAKRLDAESAVEVLEAKDGMAVQNGKIYLAPGDSHMRIDREQIRLTSEDKIHGVRPAVDHLFESAAQAYKNGLIGIILTGMGRDGSNGMSEIKKNGGYTIAQDQESSVVYGMPGNAVQAGVIDEIADLKTVPAIIKRILR